MTYWEYCVVMIDPFTSLELTVELNERGSLGWELVSVVTAQDPRGQESHRAIFKRAVPD